MVHVLIKPEDKAGRKAFNETIDNIIQCNDHFKECGSVEQQCIYKGAIAISKEYVKQNMKKRTTIILYTCEQVLVEKKRRRALVSKHGQNSSKHYERKYTGFMFAHIKHKFDRDIFYIDLVCSSHRKGKALIHKARELAVKMGCHMMGLRAAYWSLIPYYRRYHFMQKASACDYEKNKRLDRRRLRVLDETATRTGKLNDGSGDGWWMTNKVDCNKKK